MKYELTKELETGNPIIDTEHKELFNAVNTLMDACALGKGRATVKPTLEFFLSYVDKHFAHEEQLQKQHKYPNMDSHFLFHKNYKNRLKEVSTEILAHDTTVNDLSNLNKEIAVLISHIKIEDKRVGQYIHNN